jgi:hypothetical protein
MHHYYILTSNPQYAEVCAWVINHKLEYSVHLNRIRFLVPAGTIHTEFLLRYANCTSIVDPTLDLTTGLPI